MTSRAAAITVALVLVALAGLSVHQLRQIDELKARNDSLSNTVSDLNTSVQELQEAIADLTASLESASGAAAYPVGCTAEFPVGLYQLTTSSRYSSAPETEYEIYHVTTDLGGWQVNVGFRVNNFLVPTDFYFDYDGDGIIDTPLAARLVREIPLAGATLADRLISNTPVHQGLYDVFSCEWRNAEYTSVQDVGDGVSEASLRLWTLIQENSSNLVEWIQEETSSNEQTGPE